MDYFTFEGCGGGGRAILKKRQTQNMQESMITEKIYPAYTRPEKNIPRGAHGMSTSLKCQMLHPKNAKKKNVWKKFSKHFKDFGRGNFRYTNIYYCLEQGKLHLYLITLRV